MTTTAVNNAPYFPTHMSANDAIDVVNSKDFREAWAKGEAKLEIPEEVRQRAKEAGVEDRLYRIESWMDTMNDIMARDDLTESEKRNFIGRFFCAYDADVDDADAGSIGKLMAAVMGQDEDLLESMILDTYDSPFDDSLDMADLNDMDDEFNTTIKDLNAQFNIQRKPDEAALKRWNEQAEQNRQRKAAQDGALLPPRVTPLRA